MPLNFADHRLPFELGHITIQPTHPIKTLPYISINSLLTHIQIDLENFILKNIISSKI